MLHNKNRLIAIATFILFISIVLIFTGKIIRAKFIGDSTTIVDGFYAEEDNSIDMIVIGSSNSFCTVNPLVLYENLGIAAYDFGSSSQPMNISALYLKEVLKTQKPKLVALEINMMTGDSINGTNEAGLRWGLTDIPLSFDKLKCIYESVGEINAEFFSYVFPVFRYHNRWKELSKTDYTYFYQDKINYTKGYLETQSVFESPINLGGYGSVGEAWIDEKNVKYLDEIVKLCKDNSVELLLFKSPKENWYSYETQAIRELANDRGLNFIDYNEIYYKGEIDLDVSHDFRDGDHLNDFGAEKVTLHLGEYIKENYDLPDRRSEDKSNSWDKACEYKQRGQWQDFMAAETAKDCLELLQTDDNYVLIVSKRSATGFGNVEQWVYENKEIVFNRIWEKDGVWHRAIGDSELVLSKLGMVYQILIDGVENYKAEGEWNIVVYDKLLDKVVANLVY